MIQTVAVGRSLILLQHQTVGGVSDAASLKNTPAECECVSRVSDLAPQDFACIIGGEVTVHAVSGFADDNGLIYCSGDFCLRC